VGVLEIVAPKLSDLFLASDVPDGESDAEFGEIHGFHVETNGGDGDDGFLEFNLVEDGGFA